MNRRNYTIHWPNLKQLPSISDPLYNTTSRVRVGQEQNVNVTHTGKEVGGRNCLEYTFIAHDTLFYFVMSAVNDLPVQMGRFTTNYFNCY